jgi:hypothetical protein
MDDLGVPISVESGRSIQTVGKIARTEGLGKASDTGSDEPVR